MKSLTKYILLYTGYCVGIDIIDRNTNLLQKQTGFFSKAETFPYFDAWTISHIGWGMFAKYMNLPLKYYLPLSIATEVILEQLICNYAKEFIHFSKRCDSAPHALADIIYGYIGYKVLKPLP